MGYTLMIWTLVASSYQRPDVYDWRPLATFGGHYGNPENRCHEAARLLNLDTKRYRCIPV